MKKWPRYYILRQDHTTTPTDDAELWARMFERDRMVARWEYGGVEISTVFLGLDHNFSGKGPPLLFETMIFGGAHDQEEWRCSTWEEAEAQHEKAMRLVREEVKCRTSS